MLAFNFFTYNLINYFSEKASQTAISQQFLRIVRRHFNDQIIAQRLNWIPIVCLKYVKTRLEFMTKLNSSYVTWKGPELPTFQLSKIYLTSCKYGIREIQLYQMTRKNQDVFTKSHFLMKIVFCEIILKETLTKKSWID